MKRIQIGGLTICLTLLTSCASQPFQQNQAQRQAQLQELHENEIAEAAAEDKTNLNLAQNWSKLHEGMTLKEFEQMIRPDPADKTWKRFAGGLEVSSFLSTKEGGEISSENSLAMYWHDGNRDTLEFTLKFVDGKLKTWTRY